MKASRSDRALPRFFCSAALLGPLLFSACGKKESSGSVEVSAPPEEETLVEKAIETLLPSEETIGGLAARAEAFGFLSRLPQETESVLQVRHLAQTLGQVKDSGLMERLRPILQERLGLDPTVFFDFLINPTLEDGILPPEAAIAAALLGQEFFVAFGEGTAEQTELLQEFYEIYVEGLYLVTFGQFASGAGLTLTSLPNEDPDSFLPAETDFLLQTLTKHMDELLTLGEDATLPPVLAGFKTEKSVRDFIVDQTEELILQMEEMMPPALSYKRVEKSGSRFTLFSFSLDGLISREVLAGDGLEEVMSPREIDRLHTALVSKEIVFGYGVVEDYLLYFAGSEEDELLLVDSPEASLLNKSVVAEVDPHLGETPLFFACTDYPVLDAYYNGSVPAIMAMVDAFSETVSNVSEFGDTRDVIKLIDNFKESLAVMYQYDGGPNATLAFLDEGLRIESYGGVTSSLLSEEPLGFASLLEAESLLLGAVGAATSEYREAALGALEGIIEAGYLLVQKYAQAEVEPVFGEQFTEMEQVFAPGLVQAWRSIRDNFFAGVGQEEAFLVDIGGKMPKAPFLPQAIQGEGEIPRLAYLYQVEDRGKVAATWDDLEPALQELLDQGAPMMGMEPGQIKIPEPMAMKAPGLNSYFYAFSGITTADFLPVASLSDEVFLWGSSQNFNNEIYESLTASEVTSQESGYLATLNFNTLRSLGATWLDVVEKNAGEIFPDDWQRESFEENLPNLELLLEVASVFDRLDLHFRNEDGQARYSIGLRLRDLD
ncbi:MAG: hypothetical protein AAF555_06205 [Verrucomicrobiota bacterium]